MGWETWQWDGKRGKRGNLGRINFGYFPWLITKTVYSGEWVIISKSEYLI